MKYIVAPTVFLALILMALAALTTLPGCTSMGTGTGEFYVGFRTDNVLVAGQKTDADTGFKSELKVDPSQLVLPEAPEKPEPPSSQR